MGPLPAHHGPLVDWRWERVLKSHVHPGLHRQDVRPVGRLHQDAGLGSGGADDTPQGLIRPPPYPLELNSILMETQLRGHTVLFLQLGNTPSLPFGVT